MPLTMKMAANSAPSAHSRRFCKKSRLATYMKHLVSIVTNLELGFEDGSYRCNK
jgi:hypothetical protein